MYTVEHDGKRIIIKTEPEKASRAKKFRCMEAANELLVNGTTTTITFVTAFNAYSNPNTLNILTTFGFAAATAYIYHQGKASRFGKPLISQKIILDDNSISVETDFLGESITENYHAQFVELDIQASDQAGIAGILLKYGGRITPIMLPDKTDEATEVFNLISSHMANQRQLAQSQPPPPQ